MEDDPRIDAIAASDLSSSAILASLIGMLGAKGVLSDDEVREAYEKALFLLEQDQAEEPGFSKRRGKCLKRSCGMGLPRDPPFLE